MSDGPAREEEEALRAALIARTTPSEAAASRLAAAATRRIDALRAVDGVARDIGVPDGDALSRLHQRIAVDAAPPRRWWLGAGAVAVALTAAVIAGVSGWGTREDPLEHVHLRLDGLGHVDPAGSAPVVVWEQGRLDVEVDPDRGVRLAVRTAEATVTVVGTGFTVDRADFATQVEVRHGVVSVACADGTERRLIAGQRTTCLPVDPAALLRRVVALGPSGDPAQRREAIEAGLRAARSGSPGDPVVGELLAREVELLAVTDPPGALAAAEQYLASGAPGRRRSMLEFVGARRFAVEGCGAVDALRAAVAEDPASPLAASLAACADPPGPRP